MAPRILVIGFVFYCSLVMGVIHADPSSSEREQHMELSMRMIGDRLLLNAGDTTSRVLPVLRFDNQYEIRFATEFDIVPEELAVTVDSVIARTGVAEAYIVQVKECGSKEVVYSYEFVASDTANALACRSRALPIDCYTVHITLTDLAPDAFQGSDSAKGERGESKAALILIPLALLLGVVLYFYRGKGMAKADDHLIALGAYRFDPKAMLLTFRSEKVALTGKESELLHVLYKSLNKTVERDEILEKVWGDQGDYVGRTLDVFISKLRKKLESDSRIQIKNIRGVGYKLVFAPT